MAGLGNVSRGEEAFRRQFPHVDPEALNLFAESCEGQPDAELILALAEMQEEAESAGQRFLPARAGVVRGVGEKVTDESDDGLKLEFEGGDDPPRVGTVLHLTGIDTCGKDGGAPCVAMAIPDGRVFCIEPQGGATCFMVQDYGMHELRLKDASGQVRCSKFMVSSQLADYAESLDHFHDACDWVWDGRWTEELEEATMCLLIAVDDHFATYEALLKQSAMGAMVLSDMAPSKKRLEKSLAKVLEDHDAQSMGRVYGAVRGLLSSQKMLDTLGPMLGGAVSSGALQESDLYQSVVAFERARFAAASEGKQSEVNMVLSKLIAAVDAHVAELQDGQARNFVARWHGHLRSTFIQMRDDATAVIHPLPFQQLREGEGGFMMDMMKSVSDGFGGGGGTVARAETMESQVSLKPDAMLYEAESRVVRWAESLVDEAVSFGSPMAPFEVHDGEPWVENVMAAMQSLMSLGFGYVTQGSKEEKASSRMCALLDRVRASLPLDGELEFLGERRRRDRLKDVCRVVRGAKKKGQRLSLSVNSDFQGALKALSEHHSDSWVGANLEAVWTKMLTKKCVCAFELWLHDVGESKPKLVAADFGHPHTNGSAYYVATRFFDRDYRNLQPGFILAFAEAMCLKRAGFSLWDLGGADHSPMMAYKPQVAVEMDRSDYLRRLRECRRTAISSIGTVDSEMVRQRCSLTDPQAVLPSGGERIPQGVVFDDITESNLWGAASLQAREERLKAAEDAVKKAAKKIQKPSKAEKAAKKVPAKTEDSDDRGHSEKPPKAEKAAKKVPAKTEVGKTPKGDAPSADSKDPPKPNEFRPPPRQEDQSDANAIATKAAAQQYFMQVFQKLVAEGMSQQDAAAKALQVVASK